jgi:hypothetical protein
MTSRTIDIHCYNCRGYMFSLQPDDYEGLKLEYYCKAKKCQEKKTFAKLQDSKKKFYNGSQA